MFYCIHYCDNWADEMDICGFSIMDEKKYERYTQIMNAIISDIEHGVPFTYWIGTNESIEYDTVDALQSAFDVIEFDIFPVSFEELFGTSFPEFGFFPLEAMRAALESRCPEDKQIEDEMHEEYYRIDYFSSLSQMRIGDPVYIKVKRYSNTEIDAQIECFEEHFATEYYKQYGVYVYPETTQIYKELYEQEMNLNGCDE